MPQVQSAFAEINGAKFYYEIGGNPDAKPLVMLHAGVADSRMWDDQFAYFADQYRVIRFDWRGYGQTEMVAGEYSLQSDLYELLKYLKIDRAILMGCSMGGGAAVDFTLTHPEMTEALILVGSSLSGFEEDHRPAQWDEIETAYEAGDLDRCSELFMEIWLAGNGRTLAELDPKVRARSHAMNLIWLKTPDDLGTEITFDPPALGRLSEISVPTLVVVGDADVPPIIETGNLLEKGIAGAEKFVMHRTAHLPNMEQPDLFNQRVGEFLAKL